MWVDRPMCQFKHTCWYGLWVCGYPGHIRVYIECRYICTTALGCTKQVPGPVIPQQNLPQHSEHSTPSLQLLSFLRTSSGATNRQRQSRYTLPTWQILFVFCEYSEVSYMVKLLYKVILVEYSLNFWKVRAFCKVGFSMFKRSYNKSWKWNNESATNGAVMSWQNFKNFNFMSVFFNLM